ncbi:MAG: prephenate dehydrogenase/arogenate dehydrogenase family protein, partial [Lachnospiraceae bacterium]|nr:prephenate dehydrogenase/arogenate dehydrogenase family protein [Lachnospiraceae bacterium]
MMKKITCGFIGLGLIGGSIAKALKKKEPTICTMAYDIRSDALRAAHADGIIDRYFDILNEQTAAELGNSDVLFFCAPVGKNNENLQLISRHIDSHCILTDVGSVKSTIYDTITQLGLCD